MPRELRVAVVIPRYFPIYGGAENQCRLLCREVQQSNKVKIAFLLTKRIDPRSPRYEYIDGVLIRRLAGHGIDRWSQYAFLGFVLATLVLGRKHYDLIHCHASGLPGLFPTIAGMIARRPVILKISTNGELLRSYREPSKIPLARELWRWVARLNARHAHIVALNQEGYAEALAAGARSATIIANGVDTSLFRPPTTEERHALRLKHGIRPDVRLLLFSSRFVQRKGINVLSEAFVRLISHPSANGLQLLLVGSDDFQTGSARDIVERLAGYAGERVRILPPLNPPTEYLKLSDAFIFPSYREGMPNALLEAIATGLPCIVSDIAPHLELAADNPDAKFFFFRSGDSADLARAIRDYLTCPDGRTDHTGLDRRYHIRSVAERYLALYEKLARQSVG